MTSWPLASVVFFAYLAVLADWRRAVSVGARWMTFAGAALGTALAVAASKLPAASTASVLVLPASVLLVGYWTSGRLFVRPMPRGERALAALDRRLRVSRIAAATPRLVAEGLELAYSSVYPMVLAALVFARRAGVAADRFWTIVLVTDFVCFGMLAWIQTRPPRRVTGDPGWRSAWRAINGRLLDATSVQVNTFPSGHAAVAVAAALLVAGSPPLVVAAMWIGAFAVSAGAVLGRYHYAADAIFGWAVALVVYGSLFST